MPDARDHKFAIGSLPPGPGNSLTDVAGVRVGHATLHDPARGILTGVTAILPHGDDLYREKVPAAVAVINGFGKSAGLIQVAELGSIETPVLLTNSFSVAPCVDTLIRRAIAANPGIGRGQPTVNALVLECNDGYLNNIQEPAVTPADVLAAIEEAGGPRGGGPVRQGAVGAGHGMSCFGFKGGVGSSSRRIGLGGREVTVAALVLANFGRAGDLRLPDGARPHPDDGDDRPESGSAIIVIATDAPLECRQLGRLAKRAGAGLAGLGAYWGHGSGDIAVAFTTARRIPADGPAILPAELLVEDHIDPLLRAAADSTAEAVLNALLAAPAMTGFLGHRRPALSSWLDRQRSPAGF